MNQTIENQIADIALGEPIRFQNMSVFPLTSRAHGGPEYITLRRALAESRIRVREVSESGSVPELHVVNESDVCVLLLDGEEVTGAKQNRVLNTTILLAPKTETPIPVSCTEQGRWAYSSAEFADSGKVMFSKLRAMKASSVSSSLKASGSYHSNQGQVWDEIQELHSKASTHSTTGAMSDVYEQRRQELEEYERAFPVGDGQRGMLVYVNGRPSGFDLLSREEAYADIHPRLLRSYAMDALIEGGEAPSEAPSKTAAEAFLQCVQESTESRFKSIGLGDDLRYESPATVGSALLVDATPVHVAFFRLDTAGEERKRRAHEARFSSLRRRRDYRRGRPPESSPPGE